MPLSLPSPETITRVDLPNGIALLVYENHSSPSVVISGYLWAGSLSDAPDQINDVLESVGARLGFHSGVHTIGFGGKALAEDLDLLLGVLADSLQQPTFPPQEVEKLRGQILTGLQRRSHDTRRMATLTFDALLYPNHPYGLSILGYEETVPGLSREDLVHYYQGHYAPAGMVIAIVGAVSAQATIQKVQKALGGRLPARRPTVASPPRCAWTSRVAGYCLWRAKPNRTSSSAGRHWPVTIPPL